MYADKPMRGHGRIQAIARVNRVFRDDLRLADPLKLSLATDTESCGQGTPSIDTAQAVAVLLEKYEVCCDLMHGCDWSKWMTGTSAERLGLLPAGQEHVLQQEDGKSRFTNIVTDSSRAFALCATHDAAARRELRLLMEPDARAFRLMFAKPCDQPWSNLSANGRLRKISTTLSGNSSRKRSPSKTRPSTCSLRRVLRGWTSRSCP